MWYVNFVKLELDGLINIHVKIGSNRSNNNFYLQISPLVRCKVFPLSEFTLKIAALTRRFQNLHSHYMSINVLVVALLYGCLRILCFPWSMGFIGVKKS